MARSKLEGRSLTAKEREQLSLLRKLPSVERLLGTAPYQDFESRFGRDSVLASTRTVLDEIRERVRSGLSGEELDQVLQDLTDTVEARLTGLARASLRPTINATGIIVHTNLGRAPLSRAAIEAVVEVATGYSNLELDLEEGKRGSRHLHASRKLSRLFPGVSGLVVNNAAAAVMLSLNTLAVGKEVVISRGELVEIGGSFRVPEILERSGALLREVGTTNKTRIADYEKAIGPRTGALLRVHPSNFRIVGFTETTPLEELVELGGRRGLPVIEDFGSGNLLSLSAFGLAEEPKVSDSLSHGVGLTIFSGDKLLGGPQAGILLGQSDLVEACRRNPMARALRVDKMTLAALEATLDAFLRARAAEEVPVLRMIATPPADIGERSRKLVAAVRTGLAPEADLTLTVEPSSSRVGGGAAANAEIATYVIAIASGSQSARRILDRLRAWSPPIIGRIADDRVLLDLRTVLPHQEAVLVEAVAALTEATPAPNQTSRGES